MIEYEYFSSTQMFTDSPPRKNRTGFFESDRIKSLDLPQNGYLVEIAERLASAMKADNLPDVRCACAEFLAVASHFFRFPPLGGPLSFFF